MLHGDILMVEFCSPDKLIIMLNKFLFIKGLECYMMLLQLAFSTRSWTKNNVILLSIYTKIYSASFIQRWIDRIPISRSSYDIMVLHSPSLDYLYRKKQHEKSAWLVEHEFWTVVSHANPVFTPISHWFSSIQFSLLPTANYISLTSQI